MRIIVIVISVFTWSVCLQLIPASSGYAQSDGINMFHRAIRDKAGNLWFATTASGVYRYDAVTGSFTNLTIKDGLPSDNVSSVYEDKSGIFWISTQRGVCRYNPSAEGTGIKSITNFTTNEGCTFDLALLSEDSKGNLWFSSNGYGICRYNPATGVFTNYTKENGLGSNTVQCMLEDKRGNLWFGERAGGVCRYDPASDKFKNVSQGCLSSQIMGIIEDKKGNIWFANLYDGLCCYEPVSGSFIHLTEADGLCRRDVTCIYEDRNGNLWFGSDSGKKYTEGGGLCRFDGKAYTRFTEKDGILQSNIQTIVEDNEANIWVGTKGGLYRYHPQSGRFVDYTFKLNNN